jgi:triphosphoribosyl-dephospho-CoA synthase
MTVNPLERAIREACLLEATARKAGNVHPEASFEHLSYTDFVRSAEAVAPVLARTREAGVGRTILDAIRATKAVCPHNTNLGIVLLLAPLAAVAPELSLRDGIGSILSSLSVEDSRLVFQAIRLAAPRGLGDSESEDVSAEPTQSLVEVMRLAADRDLIARQFATNFELVLDFGVSFLDAESFLADWESQVIRLQLELMAVTPETDIVRKRGQAEAEEASQLARAILEAGWPDSPEARSLFADFDAWLREYGSQRNPGTVADLVTACLFAGLREGRIKTPDQFAN